MTRVARLATTVVVLFLLCSSRISAQSLSCPGCSAQSTDPQPVLRSGLGSDSGSRPYVKVCISNTWNVGTGSNPQCSYPDIASPTTAPPLPQGQTNPTVWNAVQGAISDWNSALDSSGNHIKFDFFFAGSDCTNADIMVVRTENPVPVGGCGKEDSSLKEVAKYGSPAIELSDCSAQASPAGQLGTMEHELGHYLGLNELGKDAPCTSVMGGFTGTCENNTAVGTGTLTSSDVDETLAYSSYTLNPSTCTPSPTGQVKQESNCGSPENPTCACAGTNPYCTDGSTATCVDATWVCSSGCVGSAPICPDGSSADCDPGEGWAPCFTVDTNSCVSDGTACNSSSDCCDQSATCAPHSGGGTVCTASASACTTDSNCPGTTCVGGACIDCSNPCNSSYCPSYDATACACEQNECSSASCSDYDFCTCNPTDPSCSDQCVENYDICDPDSCEYNQDQCDYDCEAFCECGDLVRGPIANYMPAPASADQRHGMSLLKPRPLWECN